VTRRNSEEEFTVPCAPPDEALDKTLKDLEQHHRKTPKMKLQLQYEFPKIGVALRKELVPEDNDNKVTPVVELPEAIRTFQGLGGREKRPEKAEKKSEPQRNPREVREPEGMRDHHQQESEGGSEPTSKWAYAGLAGAFVVMVGAGAWMLYKYDSATESAREAKELAASASATPEGSATPKPSAVPQVASPPIAPTTSGAPNPPLGATAGSASTSIPSIPLVPPTPASAVSAPRGRASAPPAAPKPGRHPPGVVKPKGPEPKVVEGSSGSGTRAAAKFDSIIEESHK
jgi:hypothetical protein